MRRAWALLALLTALNVLSWVDRQIVPALAPLLMADLGLTNAQIGLLYGYAFILCFILAGIVLGPLADRAHRPGSACGARSRRRPASRGRSRSSRARG